ncbi:MAG: flippase [Patescibacteria group bacterium]
MSIARKILINTGAQVLGKVVVAILGLAVVKITTQYLSVEGYGEYVLIYEFLAFFGIAADLGLFTIAVREMSRDESQIPKIIGNILTLRTILVTVMMILAIAVAFLIPSYSDTKIPIGVAIASMTVFLGILNGTTTSVLQAKLQMHIASMTTVISKIVAVGLMLYIIFWGFPDDNEMGFYMLIAAGNIGNFVMVITTDYYVRKITPLEFRFDWDFWKTILIKSTPYGLALILNTIYFRIDSLLISFIRGQGEVGIYGVAMKMLEHFAILPLYFMNSVLPVLTKAIKEGTDKYKKIILHAFDFLAALSIPMVVGGVVLAYPIIFAVSTPAFLSRISEGFYGSDIAFQILIFAMMFQFSNVLFAFILIAVNRQNKLLYINGVGVIFNIITNIIFIPYYGFRGAAVTSVLSELIILVLTYIAAKRYIEFSINLKNFFKIVVSALIMGAVVYFSQPFTYAYMQNWNIVVLVPMGAAIYAGMLIATRVINKETLALLKKGEETPHSGEPQI